MLEKLILLLIPILNDLILNEKRVRFSELDYKNWENFIERRKLIDEFTDYEREKVVRSLSFLREILGEDFLKKSIEEKHPIGAYILNLAPWTTKWFVWFSDALKELQDVQNFSSLLERIKNKDKFSEAISVLEIAYKFLKTGFSIIVDPQEEHLQLKVPDLKLIDKDTKEEMFVEISILSESQISRNAFHTLNRIMAPLWSSVPFYHYCGRVYKTLSERHLEYIIEKVIGLVDKVKKGESFHELVIGGVIEIGIAPERDKSILQKWAFDRDLKVGEFSGPSYNVDEILRIKRKIKREQIQLPLTHPNIIVINNNNAFFFLKDVKKVINELEEEVYKHPHILMAILYGKILGSDTEENIMKDQHIFIKKSTTYLHTENIILLLNKFCDYKITPTIITKLYNAFIK